MVAARQLERRKRKVSTERAADARMLRARLTRRAEYEEAVDDFQFRKKSSKRKKAGDETATVEQPVETAASAPPPAESAVSKEPAAVPTPAKAPAQKKTRRRFPTTPEREVEEKRVRRSKRLSDEKQPGSEAVPELQRASPGRSHANGERSPSPARGRPITVGKKRQQNGERTEQTKVMQIALPFADTPIQRRNKEMRKTSAEGHRRSSTGMRGKRASSVIDEGRGHGESCRVHFVILLTWRLCPQRRQIFFISVSRATMPPEGPLTGCLLSQASLLHQGLRLQTKKCSLTFHPPLQPCPTLKYLHLSSSSTSLQTSQSRDACEICLAGVAQGFCPRSRSHPKTRRQPATWSFRLSKQVGSFSSTVSTLC